MNNNTIKINAQALANTHKHGRGKNLYIYMLFSYTTAGLGYSDLSEIYKKIYAITRISKRTFKRWVDLLIEDKVIRIRKGVVYVKSKKFLNLSNTYIIFDEDHLSSYKDFQTHTIRQIALLKQKRFTYAYRLTRKTENAASLVKSGKIETGLAALQSAKQAGCSISKLVSALGIDKKTISLALRGVTEKQYNFDKPMKGPAARKKYGDFYNAVAGNRDKDTGLLKIKRHPKLYKFSFIYDKIEDTYRMRYSLASKINVDSFIKTIKIKTVVESAMASSRYMVGKMSK